MNPMIIKLIFAGAITIGCFGVYYLIGENAKLEKDNENLTASIKDHETAIAQLGTIVTNLNLEYSKATNDEFKKFNESDINKIPMDELVNSFNIGTKRVFRDYQNRTTKFIRGNTQTTSP